MGYKKYRYWLAIVAWLWLAINQGQSAFASIPAPFFFSSSCAHNNLALAATDVLIKNEDGCATLTADADNSGSGTLGLAGATGVTVQEATDTYETQTKEVHGSAELSFVVQHQAAEVVKAVIAVDEAKDKLEQAKKAYKAYERNVSQLEDQLSQLESDYANKVPGVNYDDVLELWQILKN